MDAEHPRELFARERVERALAAHRPSMPDTHLAGYDRHLADVGMETFAQQLGWPPGLPPRA